MFLTQVTTRSPLGAIVHETGGILVDSGWLRILGSGHARLPRNLPAWNAGRSDGFWLVADDAVGGFFAIDGGGQQGAHGSVHYFAPDTLLWEPLCDIYSAFLQWACNGDLAGYYGWIRWPGWEQDLVSLAGDRSYGFYPSLWIEQGKGGCGRRAEVPVAEAWNVQLDLRQQLGLSK